MIIDFTDNLKVFSGKGAWHYVYVPKKYFRDIRSMQTVKRGFGAVKIKAMIGPSKWQTSIFPDSEAGMYMLFIKKEVRERNSLQVGKPVAVVITIIES